MLCDNPGLCGQSLEKISSDQEIVRMTISLLSINFMSYK